MSHRFAPIARPLIAAALLLCAGTLSNVHAAPQIYTCVAANGRTLTSDRAIVECLDREQRVLGPEGTLQRIVPPSLTADERSEKENRERQLAAEKQVRAEAVKRDRSLMQRYPNAESHQKAREAALTNLRIAMQLSDLRVRELAGERKPLQDEAEFYAGKPLPGKLRERLDANEGAIAALRDAQANQMAELERVNNFYDGELAYLRRLWTGAAPGSLGATADAAASAVAAPSPAKPVAARSAKQ